MKNKLFYPAVFEDAEEGGYTIFFPDLAGALTQAETLEEGYAMATEVLGMTLVYLNDEGKNIPEPSKPKDIKLGDNQSVVVVQFDLSEYRKKYESETVRVNCTMPKWLKTLGTDAGVNFSQVLQESLMIKLDVSR